ncbi:hypothetical protein EVA_15601 [gut metagenome]|uniref:Uncharacterized protein n=1 Tax=gut metagenome TaxID=749906 RepID=J9GA21_9ZZZZ
MPVQLFLRSRKSRFVPYPIQRPWYSGILQCTGITIPGLQEHRSSL